MNVLLVGTGTVGEAIAHLVKGRKWLGKMTLADYSLDRARTVADAAALLQAIAASRALGQRRARSSKAAASPISAANPMPQMPLSLH